MKRLVFGLVIFASTLVIPVTAARAQAKPTGAAQSEVDRAVSLAHEGRALYDKGDFAQALERFRAADRIAHSPVLSLYVARCERNLTRLVAAREAYRVVVAEQLGPDASPPFVAAKADAERELAALEPRIPRVKVETPGATDATRVQLDGVVIASSARAEALWVDPGDHVLSRSDGGEPTKTPFRAVEGAALLVVELPASGTATSSAPRPIDAPPEEEEDGGGTLVPGLVVLSVGVVGLGVGVATGLVASSKTSDIEENCIGNSCLVSDAEKADSANTFATVSTISFIVAGAATAAGVVLLVTLGGDDGEETATVPRLEIAPTAGGARGTLVF